MSLKPMQFIMWITKAPELKDLHQRVTSARERKQWCNAQSDDFQEIGAQLSVKAISALQAAQEGNKNVAAKMFEHPVNHDLKMIQEITEQVKEQVKAITQKFAYFKAKINEYASSI